MNIFEDFRNLTPRDFEMKKRKVIMEFLNSLPPDRRKKLMALQFNVDSRLARSGDPLLEIQGLMWESFLQLNRTLQYGPKKQVKGNVIPFRKGR